MERRELIKRWMTWKSDRDGEKYTYRALASDAGLNPNYLSNIMTGIRNPGVKSLKRIAGAFGVTLSDFLAGPFAKSIGTSAAIDEAGCEESAPAVTDNGDTAPHNPERVSSGSSVDKSEKFGLKVSGDGKDDFDRLVSSFGFSSTDFITPDGGIVHEEGAKNESRRSAQPLNAKSVRASQSVERNAEAPVAELTGSPEIRERRLPILEDGVDDLDSWLDGFRRDEHAYESLPRTFEIEGARVFGYRVNDDSMAPEIIQGDFLFADPDAEFDTLDGRVVLVAFDGDVIIRRVFDHGDTYLLVPTNSYYDKIEMFTQEVRLMKIILWLPQREEMF